jgi:hypothetical protein
MSQNFRVTLLFADNFNPLAGYSERYDFNDGGSGQSFWTDTATQLVRARRIILSSNWQIQNVKISTVVPKLSAKTGKWFNAATQIQLCPGIDGGAGVLGVSDPTNTAFYIRQKYQGLSRTVARQLRGYPDTFWDQAKIQPTAGVINTFLGFLASIPQIEISTNKTTGASAAHNLMCSSIQRISSRRTGRPFLPLRGRRSKRHA